MSPCMENSLWKRLWTCCQTDCEMVKITCLGLQSRLFPSDFVILKILRVSHFSYALFKYTVWRIKINLACNMCVCVGCGRIHMVQNKDRKLLLPTWQPAFLFHES